MPPASLRLAELVVALSLATDIGIGMPMEIMLASCLASMRLSEALGLNDDELREVYYGVTLDPAMVEKFSYVLTLAVLYARQRISSTDFQPVAPDCILGLLFVMAFFKTGGSIRADAASRAPNQGMR